MKSIRPMYIFTILAFLLAATLFTVTHTADIKDAVAALLNIIAGGLLALLGTVVNHEFGGTKPRDAATRNSDVTVDSTTVSTTQVKSPAAEPAQAK